MSTINNTLLSLLGLTAAVYAIQTLSKKSVVKENFGMLPSQKVIVQRVQKEPNVGFVEVPGQYQAMLSPIGGAGMVDYGANIRYNMPDNKYLHSADYRQTGPLGFANMISEKGYTEGFCGGCGVEGYCASCDTSAAGCRAGSDAKGPSLTPTSNMPSVSSSYQQQMNKINYMETSDLLPVQGMGQSLNALGQAQVQPIIYDRFIYANQSSRLYAQGDPIRGDLPIIPQSGNWFVPNVNPQIDLRDGALAVVGGAQNSTSNELLALQSAATAGTLDVGGGINYGVQKSSFASAGRSDISVVAFP